MYIIIVYMLFVTPDITLKFSQSDYSVNEDMKLVKIVVVLNNPISIAITLKIDDRDSTASSKWIHVSYIILVAI